MRAPEHHARDQRQARASDDDGPPDGWISERLRPSHPHHRRLEKRGWHGIGDASRSERERVGRDVGGAEGGDPHPDAEHRQPDLNDQCDDHAGEDYPQETC
jgi:hypothetical protein